MDQNDIKSIVLSLIASGIFQILFWIISAVYNKLKNGFKETSLSFSSTIIAIWFTPIFILLTCLFVYFDKVDILVAALVTSYALAITTWVLAREIIKFRKVGIVGVDVNITKGIDYKKALKLTKRNLKVLGTGADKLTQLEDEFAEAINSASRQNRVQLLLCNPNNNALVEMAVNDGKQQNEYADNVKTSLNRLKTIHQNTEKLEIRFYDAEIQEDMPVFRLMFFNEHYCLCSFNSFGNKDKGTSAPQLHLHCPTNNNGKLLYYRAFENYFNDLWKQSEKNRIYDKDDWTKFGL
ncbi:hypothetical protein [Thalassotalea hakodatensis]|uniref:hypothetical protein n=1 Tax=Thalassotalea hakodatensis TaxID=3030492 RepID=UPI00257459A0|nr:hypothetical protein [Thalassotalea hakodatensis]